MATDTSEIDHLRELLAPLGRIDARRMFGGWGLYADGVIVAIVADGELMLKTDAQTRPVFERAGCSPFVHRAKGRADVAMSYWSVPGEALDDDERGQETITRYDSTPDTTPDAGSDGTPDASGRGGGSARVFDDAGTPQANG